VGARGWIATPIRWGAASSLYFKMAERLNCVQNAVTTHNNVLKRRAKKRRTSEPENCRCGGRYRVDSGLPLSILKKSLIATAILGRCLAKLPSELRCEG
jgi:hypothetical protein